MVKSDNGNIFGGFTGKEWHSRGEFVTDPSVFIFGLVNKDENPFKSLCCYDGCKRAMVCHSVHGQALGGD